MKKESYSNRTETLGVKNISQIKTWIKNIVFNILQGYGNGPNELSELEQLRLENNI